MAEGADTPHHDEDGTDDMADYTARIDAAVRALPVGLAEALEEMGGWWDSECREYRRLVLGLLAPLAGAEVGEYLVDMLEEVTLSPVPFGWQEAALLANLLGHVETQDQVDTAVQYLLSLEGVRTP